MKEEWRRVLGYEDFYQVSNKGRVRNQRGKVLKHIINSRGYCSVSLSGKKPRRGHMVHRLVGYAFISNPENKPFINHKNGIKTDNRLENLEWVTASENVKHAFANNLMKPNRAMLGRSGKLSPIKKEVIQYDTAMNEIARFYSLEEAARQTKTDPSRISLVCNGCALTTNRFVWRFVENNKLPSYKKPQRTRKIAQYDRDGTLVKVWDNYKEIAVVYKSMGNIMGVLSGHRVSAYNSIWKYT